MERIFEGYLYVRRDLMTRTMTMNMMIKGRSIELGIPLTLWDKKHWGNSNPIKSDLLSCFYVKYEPQILVQRQLHTPES